MIKKIKDRIEVLEEILRVASDDIEKISNGIDELSKEYERRLDDRIKIEGAIFENREWLKTELGES